MYTVLIVDDEEPVLDSYAYLIENAIEGFILAGKARTGFEAIKLLYELKPDVVFLDINMPGIDGLEALSQVHDKFPDTIFILSTAYERFDLAKRAIPLGVYAYLVKPVTRKVFVDTLEEVRETLSKKRSLAPAVNRGALCDKFLTELIWKEIDAALWLTLKEELGLESDRGRVCFVSLDPETENRFPAFNDQLSLKYFFLFAMHLDLGMYYFPGEIDGEELEKAMTSLIASTLSDQLFAVIGIGPVASAPSLRSAANGALDDIRKKRGQSGARVRERMRIIQIRRELGISPCEQVRLLFESYWEEVFSVWEFPLALAKMVALFTLLVDDTTPTFRLHSDEGVPLNPAEEIGSLRTLEEWRRWSIPAFSAIAELAARKRTGSLPVPLVKALSFIAENCHRQIQLSDVAEAASVSPVYLSRIFSEHMGTTFVDFLSVTRMERAENLIREGRMSVKEIAWAVGYQDPNYFSKSFRKIVGVSPSMYAQRARYENKD